jgi:phage terminase small subunit
MARKLDENGLTEKQAKFCDEYLIDLNGRQAAIRAGYSPHRADQQASTLLANRKVSAYIDKRMAVLSRRTGVTQERIMRELARIAFIDPTNLINMSEAELLEETSEDDRAVIQSVKVKKIPVDDGYITEREIKLADKVNALQLLGKRFKMFTDKIEAEVDTEVVVKMDDQSADWAK